MAPEDSAADDSAGCDCRVKSPDDLRQLRFYRGRGRPAGPGNLGRVIRAFTPMSRWCNTHLIVCCVTTVQHASCAA
jgi:hypothetical protein